MKDKKKILILSASIISIFILVIGITYAFLTYTKQGTTENVLETGRLTFIYNEVDKVGRGILIDDAYPIDNEDGKRLMGDNEVFNFNIKSTTTSKTAIPYDITVKKTEDSNLDEEVVRLYLTKVDGKEEEVAYNTFNNFEKVIKNNEEQEDEILLYQTVVPSGSDYNQNYRLRMWIDGSTDFSGVEQADGTMKYPYNNKKFQITVNVYANGEILTPDKIANESNTKIESISVNNTEFTKVEDEKYEYEAEVEKEKAEIVVDTENEYSEVKIEKIEDIDSYEKTAYTSKTKVERLSVKRQVSLTPGDNYFEITVISPNKSKHSYVVKITANIPAATIQANSIYEALGQDLESGYYNFKITGNGETITYPVHLYVEDNLTVNENKTYGELSDCATGTEESEMAKNMVILKVKGDLTVNNGATLGPKYNELYGGPKGFTIYVGGTLTNNGTIDNSHGAYAKGENVYLFKTGLGKYEVVPATGAQGGVITTTREYEGTNGEDGVGRQTAGGGTGGKYTGAIGTGGNGTSYSGGSGGGGSGSVDSHTDVTTASNYGGSAGSGYTGTRKASGGAGNPNGGTGGLLIIYTSNLDGDGTFSALGTRSSSSGYSGGGSGGGSINIFYKNLINLGSTNVDGGIATATYKRGGYGGKGTVTTSNIDKLYNDFLSEHQIDLVLIENKTEFLSMDYGDNNIDVSGTYNINVSGYSNDKLMCISEDNSIATVVNNQIRAVGKGTTKVNCELDIGNGSKIKDSMIVNTKVRLYLYYYGNSFDSITGGYTGIARNGTTLSYTNKPEDKFMYIDLNVSSGGDGGLFTNNSIDLTGYSKAYLYGRTVDWATSSADAVMFVITSSKAWGSAWKPSSTVSYSSTLRTSEYKTLEISIDNLNDNYYVVFGIDKAKGYAYSIWLEK